MGTESSWQLEESTRHTKEVSSDRRDEAFMCLILSTVHTEEVF